MRRAIRFIPASYYHICNKSNDSSAIFLENRDYARMLFFILFYQFSTPFFNIGRSISYFEKHPQFNISDEEIGRLLPGRVVELNAFAIMPNHFHLLIQEKERGGTSSYLHRLQGGYAKYFNAKYQKGGHVFRGSFRAVSVETDKQLLYLSAYIHRNPRALQAWTNKEISYPWSSYQDFARENRWERLLNPSIVLNQFTTQKSYREFVDTSTAKLKTSDSSIEDLFLE